MNRSIARFIYLLATFCWNATWRPPAWTHFAGSTDNLFTICTKIQQIHQGHQSLWDRGDMTHMTPNIWMGETLSWVPPNIWGVKSSHLYYRQHCEQCKAPAFKLLRGRLRGDKLNRWGEIWHEGGSPPLCQISPRCNNKGTGPPKLRFDQNAEYKHPAATYLLRDFQEICRLCTSFQDVLAVKILMDLLKGLRSYGVLDWWGLVFPKFSAPPSSETMHQTPKSFEAQECARGLLSPWHTFGGTQISPATGAAKNVDLSLLLLLRLSSDQKHKSCSQCWSWTSQSILVSDCWSWFWFQNTKVLGNS